MKYKLRFANDYGGPGQVVLGTQKRTKLKVAETIELELNEDEAAHFHRDRCYIIAAVLPPATLAQAPDEEKKTRSKKTTKESR